MKRETGTQNGGQYDLFGTLLTHTRAERRGYLFVVPGHPACDLVCHDLSDTSEIVTETEGIILNVHVAKFTHISTYKRRFAGEIYYFHLD